MERIPHLKPRLWSRSARWLLPLVALLALGLAACSSDDDGNDVDTTATATTEPSATASPTEAPEPQVLRARLSAEPETLDPQRASDAASLTVVRNLYSTLLRLDENQLLANDLAVEVPSVANGGISADGLTYTFKLRDGLQWSDGTPLVAQDFVNAAKRLFEPGSGNVYVDFYRVIAADGNNEAVEEALGAGVEGDALTALENAVVASLEVSAPDEQTVVYQLSRPSPTFLMLATLWPLSPVRQDLIDANGDTWTEAGAHVSNGPFVLANWSHGQDVTLVKNGYWHREGPLLDEVQFDIITDDAVAFLAYQEGELDIVRLGGAELVQVRGTDLESEFSHYAQLSTVGVYVNVDSPLLQAPEVRLALAAAVDRSEHAELVREGAVLEAYGWVPPGMPGYDTKAGQHFRMTTEEAVALLTDAGYPGGEGFTVRLLIPDVPSVTASAQWLQEQWRTNLGIDVVIDAFEVPAYLENRNTGNYDLAWGGWAADYPDPANWLPIFETGNAINSGNYSNTDFDALINSADTEFDFAARVRLYKQAQDILLEDAPVLPLYHGRRNVLVRPWVQGLVLSSMEHDSPGDLFFSRAFINGRDTTAAQR